MESPAVLSASLLIIAGAVLLPPVWQMVSSSNSTVASHSTLIRTLACVLALALFGAMSPKPREKVPSSISQPSPSRSIAAPAKVSKITSEASSKGLLQNVVSKVNFDRIDHGMSYVKVVKIIGSEGEELVSNLSEGVPGVTESVKTVMYSWKNRNGSNMNVMFQNDKLIQKAQFGLK